jgi:TRAP-type mannitol/chloroaromatic compound transport system permease small subunit
VSRLTAIAEAVNEWAGRIFAWLVVVMTLIIVFEVIMRRFFNSPTIWSFEVTVQLFGFYFMITAGYGLKHGSHVAIDFVHQKLPPRVQAALDVISYLIFFLPFCAVVLWQGIDFARTAWVMGERSAGVFAFPVYPIKTVVPITAGLLLLQGAVIFVRRLRVLLTGADA